MKNNLETDRPPSFSNGVVPVLPFKRILYRWRGGSSSRHSTYYDAECCEFKPPDLTTTLCVMSEQIICFLIHKLLSRVWVFVVSDSYVFEKSLDTILFRREIDI